MYSLIGTAKLNGVDPQAWLADVLARIAGHPARWFYVFEPPKCYGRLTTIHRIQNRNVEELVAAAK